jgi:diguanylate cyclase (GGDEF)-like protein/PAS domain S-box-containing protein
MFGSGVYVVAKSQMTNSLDMKRATEPLQMQQLLSVSVMSLATTAFLAVILAYMQSEVVASTDIFVWLSLIGLATIFRAVLVYSYQRSPVDDYSTTHARLLKYRFGVLLGGLVWGSAGYLLFPADDPQHQMFVIFMLAGVTAGGVISYSADLAGAIGFSILVLVQIIFRLFVAGDSVHLAMGLAGTLYLGFMVMSIRHTNRNLIENIRLRLEAGIHEESVRASEERYRLLLTHAPVGIFHYDPHLVITYCNERFADVLHSSVDRLTGLDMKTLKDRSVLPALSKALEGEIGYYEGRYLATHSKVDKWIEMTCAPSRDGTGKIVGGVAIVHDMSERKQADDELRIAAAAFEAQEGILITDANGVILRVNKAFNDITGYSAKEAIGRNPRMLNSGKYDADFYSALWEQIHNTGKWEGEILNRRKNGEIYLELLSITGVKDKTGILTNYVATFTDITQSSKAAEEIKNMAFHDPLTGLPNRRLLMDRLHQAFASSSRNQREGALLFIDLDNFKTINDTLGHNIGDLLLQQAAQRLTGCVRDGDTVARLGGDEFVVMLENLSEQSIEAATQTQAVCEKVLAALSQPYQLAQHECHSTSSIGATLFSNHGESGEELLKRADIAMYQAKKAGRNTLIFFDPKMQDIINARAALETELRKALENRQFHLHYQIQVNSSHRPLGAEALIRWLHPERGMVSPAQFVPLAEETGLILPIGHWVLETACAQLKAWENNALTRDIVLSINVSPKQFRQADFVEQVQSLVQSYAINPRLLKLELTESMLLDNIEDTIATMNALREIDVRFSLDDFGTGYSSLQYLKRLPLDQLKIDQSFICDIATDSSDTAIVLTIIAMAHSLNMDVIAEGVETEEQRQLLIDMECTNFQGYLFSKPVPVDQFEELLDRIADLKLEVSNVLQ